MAETCREKVHGIILLSYLLTAGCLTTGCIDQSPDDLKDETQMGELIGSLGPQTVVNLEGCATYYMLTAVAEEWVRPHVPEGFELHSAAPGENFTRVIFYDCDRAIFNESVEETFRLLQVAIEVVGTFPGGDDRNTWFYADVYTNSIPYRTVLEAVGSKGDLAEIEKIDDSTPHLERWSVRGDGFRFDLRFPESKPEETTQAASMEHWYPGPPHVRLQINGTEQQRPAQAWTTAILEMEGDTATRSVFGDHPAWAYVNPFSKEGNYTFTLKGGFDL